MSATISPEYFSDPNGVATETLYDPLDRVELVTRAAGTAGALVTDYRYDDYGDLEMVVHPRGNATVYVHDDAGRLRAVRRQAGETLAAGDERVLYTLNSAGQRKREAQQVYDGAAWQTETATEYVYLSRCYLDKVIHDPDDGATEVTEYAYDCDRNLTAVWDAGHPSAGQTAAPSQVYVYDALDRLTELRRPWVPGTDCRGATAPSECSVTKYRYDVQDHVMEVVDANDNATLYTTSDRDLLTFEGSPVSGTTDHRYDDHGELVETTDGRGVTVERTVDALDRVTLVDHPGTTLDTTYAYDTAPAACPVGESFPIGRLASITRDVASMDHCYDRFGRRTRDGELTSTYDANGNVVTMTYPGGVEATYGYDLVADRPVSVSVDTGAGPQPVVSGGTYLPAGPLTGLSFGNGATETRGFTPRYLPKTITWTGSTVREWTYQNDAVGNVTSIDATTSCAGDVTLADDTLSGVETIESCADLVLGPDLTLTATADVTFRAAGTVHIVDGFSVAAGGEMSVESGAAVQPPTELRTFAYRDGPYFLTLADGPWGERDWTYDRIGNRLTETRDRSGTPGTDTYTYEPNAGSGNAPLLDAIQLSPTGSADYGWDDAGNLETLVRGANHLAFTFDVASRLTEIERGDAMSVADSTVFLYDGRGFLRSATDPATGATVEPLYDSSGRLHVLVEQDSPTAPERRHTLVYLAGRPVAQLTQQDGTGTWQYLTTDHLGTPVLASDATGDVNWSGGFEPFGHDYAEGTADAALAAEVFLRLPGQWETELWAEAALGTGGVFYNVYRWYQATTGRYTRIDPLFPTMQDINPYGYVRSNPVLGTDPLGLQTYRCRRPLGKPPGPKKPPPFFNHQYACFLESNGTYKCDSTSKQPAAGTFFDELKPGEGNNPRDVFEPQSCKQVEPPNSCVEDCLRAIWSQPRRTYAIGPAGEDCHDYTDRVLYQCRVSCGRLYPRRKPANPGRPGYRESPL